MPHTNSRPGLVLALGLALVLAAALAPAGLHGRPVPAWSWAIWAAVFAASIVGFHRAGLMMPEALRRVSWLLPGRARADGARSRVRAGGIAAV